MVGIINSLTKVYLSAYTRFLHFRYSAKFQVGLNPQDVIKRGFKHVPASDAVQVQLEVKSEQKVDQVTSESKDKAIS